MVINEIQPNVSTSLVDEIHEASDRILFGSSLILPTRVAECHELSRAFGAQILITSELHQRSRAYKGRGAENYFESLDEADVLEGVVTSSAGNHAISVALEARRRNSASYVFMPTTTPQYKRDKVLEVVGDPKKIFYEGDDYDGSQEAALSFAYENGLIFVPPFNDRRIIAGQGTWGQEVVSRIPGIDIAFIPVGGMGLFAGLSNILKFHNPDIQLVAVEPAGAASLDAAMKNGSPVAVESISSVVDGASVKRVGDIPFELSAHLVDRLILVDDSEVRQTTKGLWSLGIRSEYAGALGLTAMSHMRDQIVGKKVITFVSGGNLSEQRFNSEVLGL